MSTLDDLEELSSAEEFLEYLNVPYDPAVVHVNRLHILQRFHDYIRLEPELPEEALFERYRELLTRAYQDFLHSDAQKEKVFKVFRMGEPQTVHIPLDQIGRAN